MINALGIDLEEWYHICGVSLPVGVSHKHESRIVANTDRILKILDTMRTKATFFVLGCVAEKFPAVIAKINKAGHEIASHGYEHIEIYRHTPDSFREDLNKSIEILQKITGQAVLGFRAPNFSLIEQTMWAVDILVDEGIKYDSSIFPIHHPRYGIASAPRVPYRLRQNLVEFPLSTIRLLGVNVPIGGGAYLRLWPYAFVKAAAEHLQKSSLPLNFYFHVWEIDSKQPRLKLPAMRSWSHYAGLQGAQDKFEKLLSHFQFAPMSEVIERGRF